MVDVVRGRCGEGEMRRRRDKETRSRATKFRETEGRSVRICEICGKKSNSVLLVVKKQAGSRKTEVGSRKTEERMGYKERK
jgi:hypothetical protein